MIGLLAIFIWIGIPVIICSVFGIDSRFVQFLLCGIFGVIAFAFYGFCNAARIARQNKDDEQRRD